MCYLRWISLMSLFWISTQLTKNVHKLNVKCEHKMYASEQTKRNGHIYCITQIEVIIYDLLLLWWHCPLCSQGVQGNTSQLISNTSWRVKWCKQISHRVHIDIGNSRLPILDDQWFFNLRVKIRWRFFLFYVNKNMRNFTIFEMNLGLSILVKSYLTSKCYLGL